MQDQEVENSIEELNLTIKLGDAIKRLENNAEFVRLLREYTENYALSLVNSLGVLEKDTVLTDNVTRNLESIALFKTFLANAKSQADTAYVEKQQLIGNKTQ